MVAETGPGLTLIVGKVLDIGVPPTAAVMVVAVPDIAPVNWAEYVPLLLSVTLPKLPLDVPPVLPTVTLRPPVVS